MRTRDSDGNWSVLLWVLCLLATIVSAREVAPYALGRTYEIDATVLNHTEGSSGAHTGFRSNATVVTTNYGKFTVEGWYKPSSVCLKVHMWRGITRATLCDKQ